MAKSDKQGYLNDLKLWVQELPLAHLEKCLGLLSQKLLDLPYQNCSADDWAKILQMIKPPIDMLTNALQKDFIAGFQNPGMIARVYKLIELLMRFATANAVFMTNKLSTPATELQLLQHVYLTQWYLSKILVLCYQLYLQLPPLLWQRMNQVYYFSELKGLLKKELDLDTAFSNIDSLYKACLLLSISSPYQLPKQDIPKLFEILPRFSQKVSLHTEKTKSDAFLIALDKDNGPESRNLFKNENFSSLTRFIFLEEALKDLTTFSSLRSQDISLQTSVLSSSTLEFIAKTWAGKQTREYERKTKHTLLEACIGLAAIHYFLNDKKPFMPDSFAMNSAIDEVTGKGRALEKAFETQNPLEEETWADNSSSIENLTENKNYFKLNRFDIINSSNTGFCLQIAIDDAPSIKIGDLIAFHQKDLPKTEQWHLGNIRWMRTDEQQLRIGIQILSPSALPVSVQKTQTQEWMRGLLLPELININQGSSLIVPATNFQDNELLLLDYQDEKIEIQLRQPLLMSNRFFQFSYEIISVQTKAKSSPVEPQDEFNALWNNIIKKNH